MFTRVAKSQLQAISKHPTCAGKQATKRKCRPRYPLSLDTTTALGRRPEKKVVVVEENVQRRLMHKSGERAWGSRASFLRVSTQHTVQQTRISLSWFLTPPKSRVESVMSAHRVSCRAEDDEVIKFTCMFPKMHKTREGGKDCQVRDRLKGYAMVFPTQQTIRRGPSVHLWQNAL
jgi:hypothetical protein